MNRVVARGISSCMIDWLNSLFLDHRWLPVYGPILVVTVLAYVFKVLTHLIRDMTWSWWDRRHFYFGMPFIWASLGLALTNFVFSVYNKISIDNHFIFFFFWAICAQFVFSIHTTYEVREIDLLNELRQVWRRKKRDAELLGGSYDVPEPTQNTVEHDQRVNLVVVAPGVGLITFVLFDLFLVGSVLPRL